MRDEDVVYVIDDDEAVRDSIRFLLTSANMAVQTYESSARFLENASRLCEGCIITDVKMPEIDGLSLLRRLRHLNVLLPVIVVTGHADVLLAVEAMKTGAIDFIEKPFDDKLLVSIVRSALDRRHKSRDEEIRRRTIFNRLVSLSNREREVLEGLVAGHSNKAIAHQLNISPRTVEIYRANAMTKMEATSLSGLVRMALIAGIIADDIDPSRV